MKLCTGANYSAFVLFDDRGELTSTVVTPNDCWRHSFSSAGEAEKIEFRGIWNTHPSESFLIYSTKIDLSNSGIGVTVKGTTTDPTYTVW